MREKIAGLSGMKHNIRLGQRPAGSLSFAVDNKVFEIQQSSNLKTQVTGAPVGGQCQVLLF
jgi:hypothetical protein